MPSNRTRAPAEQVAERHSIPKVYDDWEQLLADPAVEVVDIALPPDLQPPVIEAICERYAGRSGKPGKIKGILAQKPLALTYAEAKPLVDKCAAAGVVMAVNQNMRYDQSIRALKDLLGRGLLGEPVLATIDMRAIPHWQDWSEPYGKLTYYLMSIHHLDSFRYLFGNPDRVLASCRKDPRTSFPHEDGITMYILEYDGGLRCLGLDDVWSGPCREGSGGDIGIKWRVEGTDGIATGTIGWPSYPERQPSTLRYTCKAGGEQWVEPKWDEVWFPDAFVGTMAQLLVALETGEVPELDAADNLDTVALVEACYRGSREHRIFTLDEIKS